MPLLKSDFEYSGDFSRINSVPFPANRKPSSVLLSVPVKNGECLIQVMSSLVQIGQTHIHRLRFTCYSACSPLQKKKKKKSTRCFKCFIFDQDGRVFGHNSSCHSARSRFVGYMYYLSQGRRPKFVSVALRREHVRSTNRHMSTTVYMPEQARIGNRFYDRHCPHSACVC